MDQILAVFEIQGLNPNVAGKYEYQAAVYLAGRLAEYREGGAEKEEELFRHLEQYASACVQLLADGIKLHGDSFFSSLDEWFEERELGTEAVRSSGTVRESILQGFENPVFSILKDQERLKRLAKKCSTGCHVAEQEEICWK